MKMAAAKETVTKEIEGRMSAQEDTCPKEGGDITYYMDLISENLQQLLKHKHHSGQCRIQTYYENIFLPKIISMSLSEIQIVAIRHSKEALKK